MMISQSSFLESCKLNTKQPAGQDILLCECSIQEPDNDWEIAALIVGREDDRVLVFGNRSHYEIANWRIEIIIVYNEVLGKDSC